MDFYHGSLPHSGDKVDVDVQLWRRFLKLFEDLVGLGRDTPRSPREQISHV